MTSSGGDQYVRSLVQWLGPESLSTPTLGEVFAWARALDEASSTGEFWACHGELRAWVGEALDDESIPPDVKPRLRDYLGYLEVAATQSGQPIERPGEPTFTERVGGILQIDSTGASQILQILAAAKAADAADDDDQGEELRGVYDLSRAALESGHAVGLSRQLRALVEELADIYGSSA